jgi:diguanylate cyclase (GGDEF)-like protein
MFIGPLPKEAYKEVMDEFNLFRQDRVAEKLARALYGQKIAQLTLAEAEEKIETRSIDSTTGLLQKDEWLEHAEAKLIGFELGRRATDRNNSAILFQLDVEDFKLINDNFGWGEGDRCLKAAGDFIKSIARLENGDLVGRIGGDEFAFLAPYDRNEVEDETVLESIEARLKEHLPEQFPGLPSLRWNHSFYKHGDTVGHLVEKANVKGDKAVKSRVRSHSQSPQEQQKAFEAALSYSLPLLK